MSKKVSKELSQCQVIGEPPVKSWADYRNGCKSTFGGGYRTSNDLDIYRHGMETVFNLLEDEFPSAELCQAAPKLLEACKKARGILENAQGEWLGVQKVHTPEWTQPLKQVCDIFDQAIAEAEKEKV